MKAGGKGNNKSKSKLSQKKSNNKNIPFNTNPFYPIKYFCFNEVKKIVNNKNKKLSGIINQKQKIINRKKLNFEQEDDYKISIYNQRLIISRDKSGEKLLKNKLIINKIMNKNKNEKKWNSTEERYKTINRYGFYTKKIFHKIKLIKPFGIGINTKKNKFSKKSKKKKRFLKNKIKLNNNQKYMIMHDYNNYDTNNIIYRSNNINESNITLTSNTITNKTITNNTMSNNYTISNITPNSYYNISNNTNSYIVENKPINEENASKNSIKKLNNIKIMENKGRNKNNNNQNKNVKNNDKVNTVFVRRIILEEKFTIDSKGDKKTIYIKKISPIIKTKEIINSADKRLIKNTKKVITNNNNYNNNDNTFINHNDINLNFNVCSFQKINLNGNDGKKKHLEKIESFDEDSKLNMNNNTSLNDILLQNYKDLLNIKNCNTIIYKQPNGIIYKSDNHKSHQSLFPNSNKKYFIYLSGNNANKKKSIISKKGINNLNNNNQNINHIQRNSTKEMKINDINNIPLKYLLSNPRCLKNKIIHRKTKTNCFSNNIEYEKLKLDTNGEEDEENNLSNKRSFSYICKSSLYDLVKKLNNNKETDLKENIKNGNFNQIPLIPNKNKINKINEYLIFSSSNSGNTSKDNTKINSVNNSKFIKIKMKNSKVYTDNNESNDSLRCNSLNRIKKKNIVNSNYIKCFINYLKSIIPNSGRNKSHRNFLIKKCEKYDLDNIIIKNKKNNSNRMNYSNIIYDENEPKKKIMNKKN